MQKSPTRRCKADPRYVDDVFDRDRHAAEWKIDVRFLRLLSGSFKIEREISVDFSINGFDARFGKTSSTSRGETSRRTQQRLQIGDVQRRQISFLRRLDDFRDDKKAEFRLAGAQLPGASSAVNQSRGTSSHAETL